MDGSLSDSETNELTVRVVKMFLNNVDCKIPIKRADIVKVALHGNNKHFPEVFLLADQSLENIYGIKVEEVPNVSVKQYICVSKVPCTSIQEFTQEQRSTFCLLVNVLAFIYMKGNSVTGETLLNFLRMVNFHAGNEDLLESTIKKQITETFVKQLYLKKEKYESDTSSIRDFLYSWGYRADLEVPKEMVLTIVAMIFGKPAKYFIKQFSELGHQQQQIDPEDSETE